PNFVSEMGRAPALQMLAEKAMDSQEALDALLEQAGKNQISSTTWPTISSILCGDRMQIGIPPPEAAAALRLRTFYSSRGNQNFYLAPDKSQWPPEQINRAIEVSNQLGAANNTPAAAAAIQN